jgi:hypothetical protein
MALLRFLPDTFVSTGSPLDDGWIASLNMGLKTGLVFGRDLIFSYGPFASVLTRLWDPHIALVTLTGDLIVACAFVVGLASLRNVEAKIVLLLALPLVNSMEELLLVLALPSILAGASGCNNGVFPQIARYSIFALSPALAVLFLSKVTVGLMAVISLGFLVAICCLAAEFNLATTLPLLTAGCIGILWCTADQPLSAFSNYVVYSAMIAAGYGNAMGLDASSGHYVYVLILSLVVLTALTWQARHLRRSVLIVLLGFMCSLLLFVIKSGFTRQDPVHERIAFSTIGVILLMLACWVRGWVARVEYMLGLLILEATTFHQNGAIVTWAHEVYNETAGLVDLVSHPINLATTFSKQLTSLPPLPNRVSETADVYSIGQTRLLSSNLHWEPRPVFQSYAAYSPSLARLNLDHLLTKSAPTNIFFRSEPIDGRLPALEDGFSWAALLALYDPVAYSNRDDMLWLRRSSNPQAIALPGKEVLSLIGTLGSIVLLPTGKDAIWATLDIRPTMLGLFQSAIWHTRPVFLVLNFPGSIALRFRLMSGMARGGFLISPYVGSTIDFLKLWHFARGQIPQMPRPISLIVEVGHGDEYAWARTYQLRFSPLIFPRPEKSN